MEQSCGVMLAWCELCGLAKILFVLLASVRTDSNRVESMSILVGSLFDLNSLMKRRSSVPLSVRENIARLIIVIVV